ncbi:MAG: molecular chaperone DnaJ, partial [Clostridia bacterium]|nr:molecular chaperone DnaJ [Clostridia bacterium]
MADKRDFYDVLGVQKGASDDEIKKAYRRVAKENHPDLHPGDAAAEARFKEANEAYEVLSDKDKRARYDQFGHAGVDPNYGAGAGGWGGVDMDFGDLGDIFSSFFGGGGRRQNPNAPRRGSDVGTSIFISFEESAKGCKKQVEVDVVERCETCGGTGAADPKAVKTCGQCNGTGQERRVQQTPFGAMQTQTTCSRCRGRGKIIETPCKACRGSGQAARRTTVGINIPAGIDDGQVISIRGRGNAGQNGGPAGDLQVQIGVRPHPIFERRNYDIWCELPLTFAQMALGAEIQIPTLDGNVTQTVKEGTQPGEVIRLKGRGFPYLQGRGTGDQLVRLTVEVPKNLSNEQKKALKAFEETVNDKNYQKRQSFREKLKKAFGGE